MTERIARAQRAQSAWDEFIAPMLTDISEEYVARMQEVACTELVSEARADKIATLSIALKVVEAMRNGMLATIKDGEIAQKEKIKAERIEQMSDRQQRLLKIVGY
jgi:hypothetical protein